MTRLTIALFTTIFIFFGLISYGQTIDLFKYKNSTQKADSCFLTKQFYLANIFYQQSLEFKTNDEYSKNMSIECEKNLKELADKETKATIYELLGDSCLAIQDTICAKEFYLKTLVIKDNCTTRMKLAIANATFTCCPLDKYVFAILKGDTYVRWKRYDEAISSYKEALSINDKQYPKQRIKTCEQMKKQK